MKLRNRLLLRALVEAHAADGRSQRAIATRAGVTGPFLSHLLAGRKETCTPEVAISLARSLGIDPRLLFAPAASNAVTRNVA